MWEQVFVIISIIGALQGTLLAILLFTSSKKSMAKYYLAVFVLFFSLGLLEPLTNENSSLFLTLLRSLIANGSLLYGPLIFLFIRQIIQPKPSSFISTGIHFIPFLLGLCIDLWSFFDSTKLAGEPDNGILDFIFWEIFSIQLLTYQVFALQLLHQYKTSRLNQNSTDVKSLIWLRNLMLLLLIVFVGSIISTHLLIFQIMPPSNGFLWIQIAIAGIIYLMSYQAMTKPWIFDLNLQINPIRKYEKSGLKEEKANQHLEMLLTHMEQEKPYLDNQLDIFKLADALNISRNHLTEVINKKLGKNFHRFINEYRVEEAKSLLQKEQFQHFNLSSIGLEAGFNSKTSFNTNFKKITGLTPSEWKDQSV